MAIPRGFLRPTAWVVATILVVGAVVGVLRFGSGGSEQAEGPPPVQIVDTFEADAEPVEAAATSSETSVRRPDGGLAVASHHRFLNVWRFPNAAAEPKLLLDTVNPFGQRLRMLVRSIKERDGEPIWYRILLPTRPNGSMGWVRTKDVRATERRERVVVDLSDRSLTLYRDGDEVRSYSVGVGRPEYPTALGTFYVWARVPQASPSGPYGTFALGISGFSEVLSDWPGGGRMAVHGTANPGDRGNQVSHGCVRVYNPDMLDLRHLPLGTPVVIRS